MMYVVEKIPVVGAHKRCPNPVTVQMRRLAVGESFLISLDDPNWTGCQVRNENSRQGPRYRAVREGGKLRIGRIS